MRKTCLICGSISKLESVFNGTYIYRCSHCDHCFSDNEAFGNPESYSEDYYAIDHKNWFDNPNVQLFKKIYNVINSNIQPKSVIEIGCGKGDFLKFLRSKNSKLNLTGIDLTKNEIIDGIQFIQGDVFSYKYEKKYDVVIALAIIEHIEDPHAFIGLLKNICVKNGMIVIMTVNDRSMLFQISRLFKRLGIDSPYKRLYGKHHINHFNNSSLKKLLELYELANCRKIDHDIPFTAIDTGVARRLLDFVVRLGIVVIFILGKITRRTYLQTVICEKIN